MKLYIDKAAVVSEIDKRINKINPESIEDWRYRLKRERDIEVMKDILSFIDTLEVIDPYEQCIQYPSIKDGINAHAETYSFNTESKLFNQLTKEQQELWREEIEQACISGGNAGVELARDIRYKENVEVKEVDLDFEIKEDWLFADKAEIDCMENMCLTEDMFISLAKKYFELGLKTQKGE